MKTAFRTWQSTADKRERNIMTIHKSVSELIGGTPLVELSNYEKNHNLEATIVGKVELFNPAGSVKDRIAKAMLDQAEAEGKLDADTVIIEPTSGNTGIGLCSLAAARGNRIIITMPETMSVERRNLMKAYGAELVLTDGSKGMKGAIARASELAEEIPNSFIPSQFTNPANPAVHERTTGPEIWADTDGKVDILVAGVGTGGTLSGTGKYLENLIRDEIGCKCRSVELSVLQRCASLLASKTDIDESFAIGRAAVKTAVSGKTGRMMAFEREKDLSAPYAVTVTDVDVADSANRVKPVPPEFISPDGKGITRACIDYLLPLIEGECETVYYRGIPQHFVL